MNVRQPKIEGPQKFSLGQTWLASGSYEQNDLNSTKVGWQVNFLVILLFNKIIILYKMIVIAYFNCRII